MKLIALKRENKKLKEKLKSSKQIIDRLNKELADCEATIEYYNMLREEQFQKLKKYKNKYGELD